MRRLARRAPAVAAVLAAAAAGAQDIRFDETIDVFRVVLDARVVDGRGRPLLGLSPADFRVTVDGREVPLESAQWVPASAPDPLAAAPGAPGGRLIVLFFQKDLDPSRAPGLLRMMDRVRAMVGALVPRDRVAVASFASHLELWTDFTADAERVGAGLDAVLSGGRAAEAGGPPSLLAGFDAEAAREAASPEEALRVLARALREVPGPKTVVLVGHGFGELSAAPFTGRVDGEDGTYAGVRRMLEDARASVFALDVTGADSHSLEIGLQQVAEDTGGFYARTHVFSGQVITRLLGALEGHYVLTFPRPVLPVGEHAVEVRLLKRGGTVLAKKTYRG
jgi:VWFA-related protein